jgi:hypothetical protein
MRSIRAALSSVFLLLAGLFFVQDLAAQSTFCGYSLIGLGGKPIENLEDATKPFDDMIKNTEIDPGTINYKPAKVGTQLAMAIQCMEGAGILFDPDSVNKYINQKPNNEWVFKSILAHEFGHIERGHAQLTTCRKSKEDRKKCELAADEYAGSLFAKMKVPWARVSEAFSTWFGKETEFIKEKGSAQGYPSPKERIDAVERGYGHGNSGFQPGHLVKAWEGTALRSRYGSVLGQELVVRKDLIPANANIALYADIVSQVEATRGKYRVEVELKCQSGTVGISGGIKPTGILGYPAFVKCNDEYGTTVQDFEIDFDANGEYFWIWVYADNQGIGYPRTGITNVNIRKIALWRM